MIESIRDRLGRGERNSTVVWRSLLQWCWWALGARVAVQRRLQRARGAHEYESGRSSARTHRNGFKRGMAKGVCHTVVMSNEEFD